MASRAGFGISLEEQQTCRWAGGAFTSPSVLQVMRQFLAWRAHFNQTCWIRWEFSGELGGAGAGPSDVLGLSDLVVFASRCRDSKIFETLNTQLKREILASRLSATSQALTVRSEPCAMTPRRRLFSL